MGAIQNKWRKVAYRYLTLRAMDARQDGKNLKDWSVSTSKGLPCVGALRPRALGEFE